MTTVCLLMYYFCQIFADTLINIETMKAMNYLMMLVGWYILTSCGDGKVSDQVIEDTGNAILNLSGSDPDNASYEAAYLPIGDVTFDESSISNYGYLGERTIKMEQFLDLQEIGLITLEQKERVGGIYRVIVGLTSEGEKYLKGIPKYQGTVAFVAMRGANKKVGKVIEKVYDVKRGYAYYTIVLTNVTPFGKILEGFKEGDVVDDRESMKLIQEEDGTWKPYTVLDYMAK